MKKMEYVLVIVTLLVILASCAPKETSAAGGGQNSRKAGELPFCKPGEYTLSYAGYDSWLSNYSYSDGLPVWNEFEKRTGVKIDFQVYPAADLETAIQIRLSAGTNLPDICQIPPSWTNTGVMKYASEGIIIPLQDLIQTWAPNISKKLKDDPYFAAQMIAPDGNIYSVMDIMYPVNEIIPVSIIIRQDWLKKLNLKEPTTFAEWEDVLTAFAERDPNENGIKDEIPLIIQDIEATGLFGTGAGFPFSATNDNRFYFDKDGKCTFLYTTEAMKNTLAFFNRLYSKGLLYRELVNDVSVVESLIAQDLVGAYPGQPVDWISRANSLVSSSTPTVDYVMIAPPAGPDGNRSISKRFPTGMYYGITKDCKNPELAMQWIDYVGYSEEGNLLKDYGIEGKTFTFDMNGVPQYTDYIMHNPDGYSPHDAMRTVGGAPSILVYDIQDPILKKFADSTVSECMLSLKPFMVDANPLVLPTIEESELYSGIWPDIQVYYRESFYNFITGETPISDFSKYLSTLKNIGLDEIVTMKEAQRKRYDDYMTSH
jgi:putative aldouronate transport system substrate-binding protein